MISKLMLIEQVTIQEKKQQLANKGISQDIIDKLLQCDPTNKNKTDTDKVGSYTDWIISRYLKNRWFTNFNKLQSQLQQYDKSKHKIPDKSKRNIYWQFDSLNELIEFVERNQDKLAIASDEFIVKSETDHDMFYSRDFVIHVPHTKEQSIRLGSGTKWCTSQLNDNQFDGYYEDGYLFYITNKTKHQERYNLFLNLEYASNDDPIIEFADDKDNYLPYKLFDIVKQDNTLIPQIKKYFKYKNIKPEIPELISEFLNCNTVYDVVQWYKQNIYPNANVYFETDEQKIINILSQDIDQYLYIPNPTHQIQLQQVSNIGHYIKFIKNPDKEIQLQQVSHNGHQIQYIKNPDKDVQLQQVNRNGDQIQYLKNPDKDVQLQQVKNRGQQIEYILKKGITPSREIQMQQVSNEGYQIKHIENPDKDVQLQQVNRNGDQIQYLKNPDKDVQLQQVSNDGYQINYIKNPDKDVQLQQVSNEGYQIKHIENPDIKVQLQQVKQNGMQIQFLKNPDKDVQLQQVKKHGYQIEYIVKKGITPSREIQMQQVSNEGYQIKHIKNPDKDIQLQQVKQNGDQIQYLKNPDKDVQLQQVSNDGYQINYIKNPDKDVQLQQVNQNGDQIKYIENPDKDVQLQQVKENGYQVRFIENPDKDIQLQQIRQDPKQYHYIHNRDPEQTQLYKKLMGIRESASYINKLLDVN